MFDLINEKLFEKFIPLDGFLVNASSKVNNLGVVNIAAILHNITRLVIFCREVFSLHFMDCLSFSPFHCIVQSLQSLLIFEFGFEKKALDLP